MLYNMDNDSDLSMSALWWQIEHIAIVYKTTGIIHQDSVNLLLDIARKAHPSPVQKI